MISTYQRLKRQRDAGEISGFTLIELLIVIVVLGILAAVVIFALGGITGKSQLAACQADGATVSTAFAAFHAQNPTVTLSNVTEADFTRRRPPTMGSGSVHPVVAECHELRIHARRWQPQVAPISAAARQRDRDCLHGPEDVRRRLVWASNPKKS